MPSDTRIVRIEYIKQKIFEYSIKPRTIIKKNIGIIFYTKINVTI